MRYFKYLNEDVVSKALALDEPHIGKDYPPEKVKRYVELINKALSAMQSREESETNDNIVQDLRDKKKKWSNVKQETKPKKTKLEVPPDQQEEPPPPQDQQDQDQQKESKLSMFIKRNS